MMGCNTSPQKPKPVTKPVKLIKDSEATTLVSAVDFSPAGKFALSGSYDNTMILWQVSTGRELMIFKGYSGSVNSVAFSPDGKLALSGISRYGSLSSFDSLLSYSYNTLKLSEVSTGREIRTFKRYSEPVQSVAFSPSGKLA